MRAGGDRVRRVGVCPSMVGGTRRKWSPGGLPHGVTFIKLVLPIELQCYGRYFLRAVLAAPVQKPRRRRSAACGAFPACMSDFAADERDRHHGPCSPVTPAIQAAADAKRPARRGAWAGSRTEQTNGLSSVYHPMSVTATMFGNSRGNICALPGGGAARRAKPGQVAKTGGMQGMGMKLSGQPTVLVERRKNFFRNILPILTF